MKFLDKFRKDSVWKFLLGASALLLMITVILKSQGRAYNYAEYGFLAAVLFLAVRIFVVAVSKPRDPDCFINRLLGKTFPMVSIAYLILWAVLNPDTVTVITICCLIFILLAGTVWETGKESRR